MEKQQNLKFEVKKENQIETSELKTYAAPKLTKLGSVTQMVNSNLIPFGFRWPLPLIQTIP